MTSLASVTRLCFVRALRRPAQSCYYYSNKVSRKPARILTEDEMINGRAGTLIKDGHYQPSVVKHDKLESNAISDKEDAAYIPSGFPRFEKMGTDDTALSRFSMDTSCKKKREESGVMVLEGKRLIAEALQAQLSLQALFFSRMSDVISLPLPPHNFVFQKVVYSKLQRWSHLTTSPGVVGYFKIPKKLKPKLEAEIPLTLVCDNIREPGNLGSILRVAASVGCKNVVLTPGCVDVWNTKVLRSASGSHFHVSIVPDVPWEKMNQYISPKANIFFADSSVDEFRDMSELLAVRSSSGTGEDLKSVKHMQLLPAIPYYAADYAEMKDMVLIIGGETEGLSDEAAELGANQHGVRLNIPMANQVDSLNVGTALGILTFEIRRQFLTKTSSSP